MSDAAIRVEGLQKAFRRYGSNFWKAAALFGAPVPKSRYDLFVALDEVSFTIGRGERVALVGRNGAGKSTLLRHISGEFTPTAGRIAVAGKVKALFALGDGFHPEFSGRQNLKTALALNGFGWREIPQAIEEVIDFTELEAFIDRPLKEYSAGMYARLAFAAATAARPDILIIDEILGAGDAYFLGKCLQRVRDITAHGSTILFVSHDMGSALMLCERGIWLHGGRVRGDGEMTAIARSYGEHIREEQELSLRARTMRLSKRQAAASGTGSLVRLVSDGEGAPASPCHVSRLAFGDGDVVLGSTEVGIQDLDGPIRPIVEAGVMNWGKSGSFAGRRCRPFGDFGGRFVHAPIALRWGDEGASAPWVEIDIAASPSDALLVQQYEGGSYRTVGAIDPELEPRWRTRRFALLSAEDAQAEPEVPAPSHAPAETRQGPPATTIAAPGLAAIADVAFLDETGRERHTLVTGRRAAVRMRVRAEVPIADPIAVVALYRPDGTCVSQLISSRDGPGLGRVDGDVELTVSLDELLIGPGDYLASVALFDSLDASRLPEDRAYDLHDRRYALKIVETDFEPFPYGLVRQKGRWSITAVEEEAPRRVASR